MSNINVKDKLKIMRLHEQYLSDKTIIALSNQISQIYQRSFPNYILNDNNELSAPIYNDEINKKIADIQKLIADHTKRYYSELSLH